MPKEVTDVKKFLSLAKGDEKKEGAPVTDNKRSIIIRGRKNPIFFSCIH